MKWISVKDFLPELLPNEDYSENVLVWNKGRLYVMAYCYVRAGEESGFAWCNCFGDIFGDPEHDDDYYPTHWMPLPNCPIELQEDERSVATGDDSSNSADTIEKENYEYERGNE